VALSGVGLANAETQRETPLKFGMSEIHFATAIQRIHQPLIGFIAALKPETN
jgi:hypothetical protein